MEAYLLACVSPEFAAEWSWADADRELFCAQFEELPIVSQYLSARGALLQLGHKGHTALVRLRQGAGGGGG